MREGNLTIDFRLLFETAPNVAIVILPEMTVAAVTDAYLRATMKSREELEGRNLFDVFPDNPDDETAHSTEVRASIRKVFETGKPDELPLIQYDVQRPDGSFEQRFWNLKSLPEFDENGKTAYVVHLVEDVTQKISFECKTLEQEKLASEMHSLTEHLKSESRLAKNELKDAHWRLEAALEAGEIGTWTYDVLNNQVYADRSLANFFSVSEKDAAGGAIETYLTAIHTEDRERVGQEITKALENADFFQSEYRLLQADGSVMWVVARGKIVRGVDGQAIHLPGVVIDITDRKQFEEEVRKNRERLQLVLDSSRFGLWYCDLPFDVLNWSELTKEHFWLPPSAAVTIEDFYRIIHPEDREPTRAAIDQSIADRTHYDVEYRTVNAETGDFKWIRAVGRGFYDHHNQPYRFDGITIDISDDKHVQTEREHLLWSEKNARAEAENANRLKDEFLATLSHELRTPLTSILGWSRMLGGGRLDAEQTKIALETIERNAKVQSQLIEDILDVSRIISGKLRLNVLPVDLSSVIEAAFDAVRPAADAKKIRLQRILDSGVGKIFGDPDRLQQVIWNLLSNAIKFTPKGGRVQIKLERINSHVEIVVGDNGIGISGEDLPFIFERFRQSDSSTTRRHGGLGLGLAIVRHLVELHGGNIEAASEGLDKGTVFTVAFPLMAILPAANINTGELRIHPSVESGNQIICPPELKNLRILVVDDEADTRSLLISIFEACASKISEASNVAEALEKIKTNEFDILVSDIGMPEHDGYELIRQIRRLPPEQGGAIPAVALTAYARVEDRMKVLNAGFQMHVPKPVEPAELLAIIASLANWHVRKS